RNLTVSIVILPSLWTLSRRGAPHCRKTRLAGIRGNRPAIEPNARQRLGAGKWLRGWRSRSMTCAGSAGSSQRRQNPDLHLWIPVVNVLFFPVHPVTCQGMAFRAVLRLAVAVVHLTGKA